MINDSLDFGLPRSFFVKNVTSKLMQVQDDLKQQIDLVCVEKGLDPAEVIQAIENAIAGAYRKEYGVKGKLYEAEFDLATRSYKIYQVTNVVDEVTNPDREISVIDARLENPSAKVGDVIKKEVQAQDQVRFGRIASQVAKQILVQTINNFQHTKILKKFKDQIGDVVKVEVDYPRKGGYVVRLDKTMGYLSREHLLPIDKFRSGQLINALIVDITEDSRGNSQIILSRTHPDFVKAIIRREVPEVASEIVTIEKVVREPGVRSKVLVSVTEEDSGIDPVGTILGRKNVRLINIMREITSTLQEKVDIVEYDPNNLDLMVMDALEPAEIEKVEVDELNKKIIAYCYPEEASLAVGKKGLNVKLASELLGYEIEVRAIEDEDSVDGRKPEIIID
jgi:N utilization substance protein A